MKSGLVICLDMLSYRDIEACEILKEFVWTLVRQLDIPLFVLSMLSMRTFEYAKKPGMCLLVVDSSSCFQCLPRMFVFFHILT